LNREILECWRVVDDLKTGQFDNATLAKYYERKFEILWNTFEEVIRTGQLDNTHVAQLAEAGDLKSPSCEFDSHRGYHARVAQSGRGV
jgi:hypothetical protein